MRTRWTRRRRRGTAGDRAAVADRHGVRAGHRRAPHADAAAASRRGDTALVLVDLGAGRNRLGGSCLAQVLRRSSAAMPPDLDDPRALVRASSRPSRRCAARDAAGLPRPLRRRPVRDRCARWPSPGGAGWTSSSQPWRGIARRGAVREELGAVLQVRGRATSSAVRGGAARRTACGDCVSVIGHVIAGDRDRRIRRGAASVLLRRAARATLHARLVRDELRTCRRCATIPAAPTRNTTAGSTPATPA